MPVDNGWPESSTTSMMCPVKTALHPQRRSGAARGAADGALGTPATGTGHPQSPAATRASRRTWKDPRLLVGVTIVAVSVLIGSRLFAAADDTVSVWAVTHDMPAGSPLTESDVQPVALRFGSPPLAHAYLSADAPLPAGAVLARKVTADELLPRAALGTGEGTDLVDVPVSLPTDAVPTTLQVGEVVDVWVTPETQTSRTPRAVPVLEQVRVVALPHDGTALGPSTTRQVVIGIPAGEESRLSTALAQLASGTAVVVGRG